MASAHQLVRDRRTGDTVIEELPVDFASPSSSFSCYISFTSLAL